MHSRCFQSWLRQSSTALTLKVSYWIAQAPNCVPFVASYRVFVIIYIKNWSHAPSPEHQKSIQDPVITSRNNRYVIPDKTGGTSLFQGSRPRAIHKRRNLFVEPLGIVQMNNELHEAAEAEHREIRRILLNLTDRVRENLHELELSLDLLAELDFLNAKARFSLALNAVEPKINTRGVVKLIEARHPLLEFHIQNADTSDSDRSEDLPERVVPTNIHIGDTFNSLIITGPNTGGKTIVLKTVGLLTLMAQSGLHIPAEHGSEIAIFDLVFADIGDDQGIEQSLSTFSSHITKIAEMLKKIEYTEYALVLLDEIGAGTDPSEGAALGMALLDWLGKGQVNTIVTTHYGALKAYAHTQENMENASMEFDWTTLRPTYRLHVGIPGSSNAIKIAARLGMPSKILDEAQAHLGNNTIAVEDLLVRLQETQNELDTERNLLQSKIRDADTAHRKHTQLLQTLETDHRKLKQEAKVKLAISLLTHGAPSKISSPISAKNKPLKSVSKMLSQNRNYQKIAATTTTTDQETTTQTAKTQSFCWR